MTLVYPADGKVGQDCGNGMRTDLDYNERGFTKLTNSFRLSPSQPYTKRDYWRDSRDRITWWKKAETGRGDRYSYDAEGQLTNASYQALTPQATPTTPLRGDNFTYDALGNRVGSNWIAGRGSMNFTRRDNGLNQYWSWENNIPAPNAGHFGTAIYYDDNSPWTPWNAFPGNGVTMADGLRTASYNALNQPVAMIPFAWSSNVLYFGYDPLGRCVKRWVGTSGAATSNPATYMYYDGWNLIEEGTGAGTTSRNYVHGARVDEIVKQLIQYNPSPRFFHYDARGHCTLQTDANGSIAEQYEYDAFGYPYFYNASGTNIGYSPWGNRFLFTGREWLSDVKLYDYRNRVYQPELGRFLQPDPKHFAAGDYNLYRYCHNDPVNHTDPLGLTIDFEYPDPSDAAATRAMIGRLEAMGGEIGATIKQLRDSTNRTVYVPIQRDVAGWDKYNLNPRAKGDDQNKTTPRNEENSRNGKGTGNVVEFDPNNSRDVAGNKRPPIEGVGHEARHAAANDKGNRLDKAAEEKRAQDFQKLIREKLKEK